MIVCNALPEKPSCIGVSQQVTASCVRCFAKKDGKEGVE